MRETKTLTLAHRLIYNKQIVFLKIMGILLCDKLISAKPLETKLCV